MKTAISMPDDTFERASRRADQLGMSRSEFVARATQRYLDELDEGELTRQIDQAIERVGHDDSTADAVAEGRRRLAAMDDEW